MEEIRMFGPMFDGRALAETELIAKSIEDELSKEAMEKVHQVLGDVLQHPTGYYESQIQTEKFSSLGEKVTDGGVIYGPWLEGTSSKNETTRFKGYATFRRVSQEVEREAKAKAEEIALRHLGGMN